MTKRKALHRQLWTKPCTVTTAVSVRATCPPDLIPPMLVLATLALAEGRHRSWARRVRAADTDSTWEWRKK